MDEILFQIMQDPVATLFYLMGSTGSGILASEIFKKMRELYPQPTRIVNFSIGKGIWSKLRWWSHLWFYKSLWIRRYAHIHVILLSAYVSLFSSILLAIIYKDYNLFMNALIAAVSNQALYNWKKKANSSIVLEDKYSKKEEGNIYGYPSKGTGGNYGT